MAPPPPHPASPAIIIALSHPRLSLPDRIMPPVEFGGAESCAWSFGWRRNAQRAFSWRRGEQERERAPLGFLVASTPRRSWLAAPLLLSPHPQLSPSLSSFSFLSFFAHLPPSLLLPHPSHLHNRPKGSSRPSPTCPRCRTPTSPSRSTTSPATAGSRRSSSLTPSTPTSATRTPSASATLSATRTTATGRCTSCPCSAAPTRRRSSRRSSRRPSRSPRRTSASSRSTPTARSRSRACSCTARRRSTSSPPTSARSKPLPSEELWRE